MRATLHDAEGPWQRRLFGMGIAVLVGIVAFAASLASLHFASALMIAAVALGLLSRPLTRRARERDVLVSCKKGRVAITEAGLLNRTIVAKDIIGATTARHGEKNVLSLALRGREGKPLHFELESEDDVKRICDALGIGHGGFGAVGFTLHARPRDVMETWSRIVAGVLWAALAVAIASSSHWGLSLMLGVAAVAVMHVVVVLAAMRRAPAPSLVLRGDGAHEGAGRQWRPIPYGSFFDVKAGADAIESLEAERVRIAAKPSSWLADGMSVAEREILVSQLRGAAARSFGQGAIKDDGPAMLESLHRNGASVEQWLGHLDALAATVGQNAGAYRGGTLAVDDLWRVVEDPDATAELRMAATRVLAKVDAKSVNVRVAPLLETVRDEGVKKRIRVAMEDDGAVVERELLALEAQERVQAKRLG